MHQNHGLLHIKNGTHPLVMKSTRLVKKLALLWIIFLVRKHDPKYFAMFIGFTNIHFFSCSFVESTIAITITTFGFTIYCFKRASCACSMCFFIKIIPWVDVYCTKPFL